MTFEENLRERIRFLDARIHMDGPRRDYLCERDCLAGVLEDYKNDSGDADVFALVPGIVAALRKQGLITDATNPQIGLVVAAGVLASVTISKFMKKEDHR